MVLFNYSTKELTAKVVYYGPGLCGKTTNLQWIHEKLPIRNKGKMLSLATEADRTLFFDFLPIDLGTIRGMKTRVQLYTVPGQVFYNATRRMVLKGADCVVFVADSQEPMLDANLDSLANLRENLEVNEIDPEEIPMVLQYNKRDLPNALPVEILNEKMNPRGLPFYEAVARGGQGVEETLKGATGLVFKSLAAKYGGAEAPAAAGGPGAATVPPGSRPAEAAPPAAGPAAPAARTATPPVAPAPAPGPRPLLAPPAGAAAPTRPEPVSAAASAGPSAAGADTPDELLDSLDLGAPLPAEEGGAELDLGSASSDPPVAVIEEIEPLQVEDLSFEPEPEPPTVVPTRPGKTTLVRKPDEAEDLRRRIGRPAEPELVLDELEEEDVEEISFDGPVPPGGTDPEVAPDPPPRAAPPPPAPPPRPAPVSVVAPLSSAAPRPAAAPAAAPAPPPAPAPAAKMPVPVRVAAPAQPPGPRVLNPTAHLDPATNPNATIAPVPIQVPAGTSEVTVPVHVTVGPAGAVVTIHLRLTLNVQVDK